MPDHHHHYQHVHGYLKHASSSDHSHDTHHHHGNDYTVYCPTDNCIFYNDRLELATLDPDTPTVYDSVKFSPADHEHDPIKC